MASFRPSTLLKTGAIGTVIAALCCFTPVLALLFGAVGLAAFASYLDLVLIPILTMFVALTIYALFGRKRT